MKKILVVTGGAGFVGSNLIEFLIKKTNFKVISLDDYSSGTKKNHLRHKSCLLYTSPSPRDATLSRMPSSA